MAPTSMMTKFLLLVSIWLVMVVAVFGGKCFGPKCLYNI